MDSSRLIELKSGRVGKISKPGYYDVVFPFMSFHIKVKCSMLDCDSSVYSFCFYALLGRQLHLNM